MAGDTDAADLARRVQALPITLALDDADQFRRFLRECLVARAGRVPRASASPARGTNAA